MYHAHTDRFNTGKNPLYTYLQEAKECPIPFRQHCFANGTCYTQVDLDKALIVSLNKVLESVRAKFEDQTIRLDANNPIHLTIPEKYYARYTDKNAAGDRHQKFSSAHLTIPLQIKGQHVIYHCAIHELKRCGDVWYTLKPNQSPVDRDLDNRLKDAFNIFFINKFITNKSIIKLQPAFSFHEKKILELDDKLAEMQSKENDVFNSDNLSENILGKAYRQIYLESKISMLEQLIKLCEMTHNRSIKKKRGKDNYNGKIIFYKEQIKKIKQGGDNEKIKAQHDEKRDALNNKNNQKKASDHTKYNNKNEHLEADKTNIQDEKSESKVDIDTGKLSLNKRNTNDGSNYHEKRGKKTAAKQNSSRSKLSKKNKALQGNKRGKGKKKWNKNNTNNHVVRKNAHGNTNTQRIPKKEPTTYFMNSNRLITKKYVMQHYEIVKEIISNDSNVKNIHDENLLRILEKLSEKSGECLVQFSKNSDNTNNSNESNNMNTEEILLKNLGEIFFTVSKIYSPELISLDDFKLIDQEYLEYWTAEGEKLSGKEALSQFRMHGGHEMIVFIYAYRAFLYGNAEAGLLAAISIFLKRVEIDERDKSVFNMMYLASKNLASADLNILSKATDLLCALVATVYSTPNNIEPLKAMRSFVMNVVLPHFEDNNPIKEKLLLRNALLMLRMVLCEQNSIQKNSQLTFSDETIGGLNEAAEIYAKGLFSIKADFDELWKKYGTLLPSSSRSDEAEREFVHRICTRFAKLQEICANMRLLYDLCTEIDPKNKKAYLEIAQLFETANTAIYNLSVFQTMQHAAAEYDRNRLMYKKELKDFQEQLTKYVKDFNRHVKEMNGYVMFSLPNQSTDEVKTKESDEEKQDLTGASPANSYASMVDRLNKSKNSDNIETLVNNKHHNNRQNAETGDPLEMVQAKGQQMWKKSSHVKLLNLLDGAISCIDQFEDDQPSYLQAQTNG